MQRDVDASVEGMGRGVNHRARCRTPAAPTRSASVRTEVKEVGSSSLLVIQVHGRNIAPREAMVANGKILVNQWKNEPSFRYELSHHLVFTKSDEEPGGHGHV
jgi:hypothetical protein